MSDFRINYPIKLIYESDICLQVEGKICRLIKNRLDGSSKITKKQLQQIVKNKKCIVTITNKTHTKANKMTIEKLNKSTKQTIFMMDAFAYIQAYTFKKLLVNVKKHNTNADRLLLTQRVKELYGR